MNDWRRLWVPEDCLHVHVKFSEAQVRELSLPQEQHRKLLLTLLLDSYAMGWRDAIRAMELKDAAPKDT